MLLENLFFGFIVLMLVLMIMGIYFKAGIFNMLSAGVSLYLIIGLVTQHEGQLNQIIALALVFFGLTAVNFYYAFWGKN